MRRQFVFHEPAAQVTVTIDVLRKPKKQLPRDVPRITPKADELAKLVGAFVEAAQTAPPTHLEP